MMSKQQLEEMLDWVAQAQMMLDRLKDALFKEQAKEGIITTGFDPAKSFDGSKILWKEAQGKKGPFEVSKDFANVEFKRAMELLKVGPLGHAGFYYWVMPDGQTLARKPSKR